MKYRALAFEHAQYLESAVSDLLEQGWQLQGGLFVAMTGTGKLMYCQAMVYHIEHSTPGV